MWGDSHSTFHTLVISMPFRFGKGLVLVILPHDSTIQADQSHFDSHLASKDLLPTRTSLKLRSVLARRNIPDTTAYNHKLLLIQTFNALAKMKQVATQKS
jgi:hypothetical protein